MVQFIFQNHPASPAPDPPPLLRGSGWSHILPYFLSPFPVGSPPALTGFSWEHTLISSLHKHCISGSASGTLALRCCYNLFLQCLPYSLSHISKGIPPNMTPVQVPTRLLPPERKRIKLSATSTHLEMMSCSHSDLVTSVTSSPPFLSPWTFHICKRRKSDPTTNTMPPLVRRPEACTGIITEMKTPLTVIYIRLLTN